jgi:hypothetical protein
MAAATVWNETTLARAVVTLRFCDSSKQTKKKGKKMKTLDEIKETERWTQFGFEAGFCEVYGYTKRDCIITMQHTIGSASELQRTAFMMGYRSVFDRSSRGG